MSSPPRHRKRLLIVEDDLDLAEMLSAYFNVQGYRVLTAAWGEQGLELASRNSPDLVILDVLLPDIDGFEVCRRLREKHTTRSIPIIFLTEKRARDDRLHGLELGVVDYITKPFDIQELRLRVRNILRRATTTSAENPVTGLPEGETVDAALSALLKEESGRWGVLVVTLKGLDTFRELYGFIASDDVLRVVSLMLRSATTEVGGQDAFCGHLGPDTFVMLLPADKVDSLEARIRERAGQSLEYFYPGDNRGPNAHTGDRLRLSIGRLTAGQGPFKSLEDLKKQALDARTEARGAA